jgi:hypothetical protein
LERKERDALRKQWLTLQEETKNEDIEITYSYWDGSGHRKVVTVSFPSSPRQESAELLMVAPQW